MRWGAGLASGVVGRGVGVGVGGLVGGWRMEVVGLGWCVVGMGRVATGGRLGVGQGSLLW